MVSQAPSVYTDLKGLNEISVLGRNNTPAGLKKVAEQFESMFINMMLKSMRESNSSLFEDNYLSSNEMTFHQQNLDNQLSMTMSSAGGIGLADSLYRQMLGRFDLAEEAAPAPVRQLPQRRPAAANSDASLSGGVPEQPAALSGPQEFVSRLLGMAKTAAQRLGLDPRVLLAQSALETGWGRAVPASAEGRSSFNLFGVKADARWTGDQVRVRTLEFRDGVMQQEQASFRAYESYEESFSDYVNFLETNPRYSRALDHTGDAGAFAEELQRAGYATDPQYANKLREIMDSPAMISSLRDSGELR